jgi:hypothetical protein
MFFFLREGVGFVQIPNDLPTTSLVRAGSIKAVVRDDDPESSGYLSPAPRPHCLRALVLRDTDYRPRKHHQERHE